MKDLIILVGTNPLPCYISALYLYQSNQISNIYLICSERNEAIWQEGTVNIAKRIKNKLSRELLIDNERINIREIDDIRSLDSIKIEVNKIRAHEILLNFTGGTKTMDVFFYNECEKIWLDRFSSSYLDARTNQMIVNGHIDSTEDLRKIYNLSLKDLAYLHNINIVSSEPVQLYENALKVIDEYIEKNELKSWLNEYDIYKKEVLGNGKDYINDLTDEQKMDELNLSKVRRVWDQFPEVSINRQDKINFMNGVWLEYWIYKVLNQDTAGIKYYFDINSMEAEHPKFQLDICAVYGYQLTVISVTAKRIKKEVKLKVFEALHRAIQLGGGEARIIQVSLLDEANKQEMERDIEKDIGSIKSDFLLIGLEDIQEGKKQLRNKITEYIIK